MSSHQKEIKYCKNCGVQLKIGSKQKYYCSKSCGSKHQHIDKTSICKGCGVKFIINRVGQEYHNKECSEIHGKVIKQEELNRPYTSETESIILMWYNNGKGNSKVEIAQILGRSLESVEKAFV